MTKIIGLAVGASLLLGAGVASAASITNIEFQNGDVAIQGTGGSTVTAKVRIVVGINEVVEKIQTDVLSDNLAPICVDVGGDKGLEEGTHFVDLQVKLPPNTGTYTLAVQGSGVYGPLETVDCTSNVVATASFSSALKVVSGSGGTVGGSDKPSWLDALVASIIAAVKPTAPTPPVASTACSTLATKMVGTMDNTYNQANIMLQGYLLSEGMSIPALAAGASFGYKSVQTNTALSQYKTMKGCI